MSGLLGFLGGILVVVGIYFVVAHPYTRAHSYARSRFISGGGNPGIVMIVIGIIAIVIDNYIII